MDDLITRAAAIEYLMTNMGWHDEDGYEVDDADEKLKVITDLVNGIPAVDAAPVVHARWEPSNDYNGYCRCSVCHDTYIDPDWIIDGKWQYCPHCGAKMDEEG